MPANLTPQYMDAEQRFKQAATNQEKVTCLEEMLRVIPKHKGTDKLQADLKRRLSKLRQEAQKSSGARRATGPSVVKEGAGQIALVGLPNSGKSALLGALSKAVTEVADYPFTTRKPIPGMVVYKNIQIQLVDLPPISRDYMETWLQQIVRSADALLMAVDVSDPDALEAVEFACGTLAEWKISPVPPGTAADGEDLPAGVVERPTLLLGTKCEDADGEETWAMVKELYGERWPRLAVSALAGHNLDELRAALYDLLGKIRVYTKAPGKKPDLTAPFTLPRGSTVSDVAATVHKDFAMRLKFARIWGKEKYDGQMVQRDYVVQEEDVIELHV